jgi:FkbM family methyltransferase
MLDYLREQGLLDQTGRLKVPKNIKRIKIDVGLSQNAPMSARWLDDDPELLVFGFEPSKECHCRLTTGTSIFDYHVDPKLIGDRFIILPKALSKKAGWRKFYSTEGDGGQSSLFRPKDWEIREEYDVECWTLDNFINLIPEDRFPIIDHVKTDCQGGDFDVLLGALNVLTRVAVYTLEIETKQYHGTNFTRANIDELMTSAGFFRVDRIKRIMLKPWLTVQDPTYMNSRQFKRILTSRHRYFQRG